MTIPKTETDRIPEIRMSRTILLTGMMGIFLLVYSWLFAIACPLLIVFGTWWFLYDQTIGMVLFGLATLCFCFFGILRWFARGLLDGRKGRVIAIAALLLSGAIAIGAGFVGDSFTFGKDTGIALLGSTMLVFALLALNSLRDKNYWVVR